MDTQKALDLLEKNRISSSRQMLLRWIRQGKIKADMTSKKQGYEIDSESLKQFILQKQALITKPKKRLNPDQAADFEKQLHQKWQEGYDDASRNRALAEKYAVKDREKELIQKNLYEEQYVFSQWDLKKVLNMPVK